jgi:hypothetical protein
LYGVFTTPHIFEESIQMQNPPSDYSKGGKKIAMKKKNYRHLE